MSVSSGRKQVLRDKDNAAVSLVDASWELVDPCPDVHALFIQFDQTFFGGALAGCEVRWSPRMTLCAGQCHYEGGGGLCSIRLSKPLLKLRPRKDLVETLLHEMIHAYLFVTQNNRDREGHGPEFQSHMRRINDRAGTAISVYHSFHNEVAVYKQHWWRCQGTCRERRPYFGWVKRASNRAPGPNDLWWAEHQRSCAGRFEKVREPEGYAEKQAKKQQRKKESSTAKSEVVASKKSKPSLQTTSSAASASPSKSSVSGKGRVNTLDSYFAQPSSSSSTAQPTASSSGTQPTASSIGTQPTASSIGTQPTASSSGTQPTAGGSGRPMLSVRGTVGGAIAGPKPNSRQQQQLVDLSGEPEQPAPAVDCPACSARVPANDINQHLDTCLS